MEKIVYSTCPLCKSNNIKSTIHLKDYSISKEHFEIWKCRQCSFLFTQNIPDEESIGTYYASEEYISHSDTKKGIVNRLYHIARKIMLGKKYRLIKKTSSGKNILDIGCGTGYFLNHMQKKGFQTLGVEVSEQARNFGKQHFGLNILPPEKLLQEEITQKFKVITLWHVLEHVYQPETYLKKISNRMDDDGILILALPNPASYDAQHYQQFWAGYDVPRHLWHFTPQTITQLTSKFFTIIKLKRLPLDSFYNSILSETYRNKKLAFIRGSFIGFIAFLYGLFNRKKSSSVIYVLKKKMD
ncbi:MAG: class I SAM-dependent methyltransferase [Bacteroidales bacterium]|jgi:2-polyprenyl-3-methyl-5-hydroxy-6-metoxy-1,4-benzoquinol methylase|nr:class I SAM-dependent methyltransferase [Bacteroidales bacterium]